MSLRQEIWASLRGYVVLAALFGGLYSLFVLGAAHVLSPHTANGSLVTSGGQVVGSTLIGQAFTGPRWFHGRPSATSPTPYNAANSGGTNYGPTNPALISEVAANMAQYPGIAAAAIPPDLVESSASGLDPDITPQAALIQVPIVAAARGMNPAMVRALVAQFTEKRWLGMYGAPRVNVLELNLALAKAAGRG